MTRDSSDRPDGPGTTRRRFLETLLAAAPAAWFAHLAAGCDSGAESLPPLPGVDPAYQFPERYLPTLRALVDRLLPADQDPGALQAGAPEFIVNELATRFFESSRPTAHRGIAALDKLAQRELGRPFADAAPEQLDQLLRDWQVGNVSIEDADGKEIVDFYLQLTLEGFLGAPIYGGNKDEIGWKTIGFHRCGPQPRREALHPDPLQHPSRYAVSHERDQYDAVIVGSGAGGGPVAQVLSQAGMKVVILEKGPWYTKRDFIHDEIMMSRRDFFTPTPDRDPHIIIENDRKPDYDSTTWISNCVGGGTVHYSGFFLRLHPEDFRIHTLLGDVEGANLADWPIEYGDFSRYYDWVERELGVSGKLVPGQIGSPFPLPALRQHPFSAHLEAAAQKLGALTFQTPRAILSRNYDGRPPCNYCGFCGSYGCENDSKSSSLSGFLPHALATGNCHIRPLSQAIEILTDDQGRASAVRYLDADGKEHQVKGKVIVVAASATESARLLLLSQSGKFTSGMANSTGLVGQNLVMSTFAGGQSWLDPAKLSPEAAKTLSSHHPFMQRATQSYYWDHKAGLIHPKVGSIVFLWHHPNPINTVVSLAQASRVTAFGSRLKDRIRDAYHRRRKIELECFVEFLPNSGSHITLDSKAVDRFGRPAARITIMPHASARPNALHLVNKGIEIMEAAGGVDSRGVLIGTTTRILQGGTCRFGNDPDRAVLDPDCQAFDVPNLYVTDGSFMPSGGSVPFTLTIMANAARVAHRIVEKSKRGELG